MDIEISLIIIVAALLFSNFAIIPEPAYSQEETSSPTIEPGSSQDTNNENEIGQFIIFLIIVAVIASVYEKLTKRYGKHRERRYFTAYVKKETLQKQNYKCAICKKSAGVGIMITRTETGLTTTLAIVKRYVLIVMQRKHVDY